MFIFTELYSYTEEEEFKINAECFHQDFSQFGEKIQSTNFSS